MNFQRLALLALFMSAIVSPSGLFAQQSSSAYRTVYEAYLTGNSSKWRQALHTLQQLEAAGGQPQAKWELCSAAYGFMGLLKTSGASDEAQRWMNLSEQLARQLLKQPAYDAQAHALLGAICAMQIDANPLRAISLGQQSKNHLQVAQQSDRGIPMGWIEQGNVSLHAPRLFGGDVAYAIVCFEKALAQFNAQPALKTHNWHYLHTLSALSQAHLKRGDKTKAKSTLDQLLGYEPRFSWAKENLVPRLYMR